MVTSSSNTTAVAHQTSIWGATNEGAEPCAEPMLSGVGVGTPMSRTVGVGDREVVFPQSWLHQTLTISVGSETIPPFSPMLLILLWQ